MNRRIGVVVTGRSDRGHLAPLLALLPDAYVYDVAGHPMEEPANPYTITRECGRTMGRFSGMFASRPPDLLVVFGDRWEQLAAATAAMLLGIPIAHLHAGETTEAVYDDQCRAAISAMATWHLAAAEPYEAKLRSQGYPRVHCLGAPGLSRLKPKQPRHHTIPVILVQFHPETRNLNDIPRQVNELMEGIADIPAQFVITEPGMDAGREHIVQAFKGETQNFTDDEWLDQLAAADVLVGNSSCGIIETPSIPLPSVNIGDRQKGRLLARSVITVPHDRAAIRNAVLLAFNPEWREAHLDEVNPYGDRGAAPRIAAFLQTCAL